MTKESTFDQTVAGHMEAKALDENVRDKTFIIFRGEEISFGEFYRTSSSYAHLFQSLFNASPAKTEEIRAAVFMDNHPVFLYSLGGCALTGGTLFGVNTGLRGDILADVLNKARCQFLITDDRHYDRVKDIRDKLKYIKPDSTFLVWTDVQGLETPQDLCGIHDVVNDLQKEMGDAAFQRPQIDVDLMTNLLIIYSSGITGLPKGIRVSHNKMMRAGMGVGAFLVGMEMEQEREDRGYACMPLFHSNSMLLAVMPAFVFNVSFVLKDRFSASGFAPDILKHGVTWWNYVGQPVHYVTLALERAYGSEEVIIRNIADDPNNRLRVAFGNGASSVDQEKFIKYFDLENMMESYGSTEMAISVMGHKDNPRGSVGLIIDPDVKIYSESGEECPPAEYDENGKFLNYTEAVGEIVREGGPLPEFEGYHELPEEDARKIKGGNYHSGDLGHTRVIDGNRYLYFDGRTDDWIRKDGENFSAENVAQAVGGFPAFELAAAYGVPCPVSDEWVMSAVKLREGMSFDAEEFHAYIEKQCRTESMDRRWKPDFIRIVGDFEFTRTEKVLVRPLKHEFYNLEWLPEGTVYFFRRGFDKYKLFTKKDLEALRAEFKETGREQLLDTWR